MTGLAYNNIVDFKGLCELLKVKEDTLRHNWRLLPHFFLGPDSNSRPMARFDMEDVLEYLKRQRGHNYGGIQIQGIQGRRQEKERSRGIKNVKDRHNLLTNI